MTRLESEKTILEKSAREVYEFLSDFNNYQRLMPEQVTDWKSTRDECSFTIQGMASLGMKIKERIPDKAVIIERQGKAPFDFLLNCRIEDLQSKCSVQLSFDADLNPMLKMMAAKPLTNFLNMMVDRLKAI